MLGTVKGFMDQYPEQFHKGERPADRYERRIEKLEDEKAAAAAPPAVMAPANVSLNIDGRQLAQSVITWMQQIYSQPMQAPSADGLVSPYAPDHNFPDK